MHNTKREIDRETKERILAELKAIAAERLFGDGPWLADRNTNTFLHDKLVCFGLTELCPDEPDTLVNTPLGSELNVDLISAFMGHTYEWDVPMILHNYGLITTLEMDFLYETELKEDAEFERLLRPFVQKAYIKYFKQHRLVACSGVADGSPRERP